MEEFRNTFVSSVVICCNSHQILNFASYNPCSRLRSYIRKNPNPSTKVQQNSKLNKNMSDHNTKLLKDLTKAFECDTRGDHVVIVHGNSFKVSRFVLRARSDFFAKILELNTATRAETDISSPSVTAETFEEALRYFYRGNIGNINEQLAQQQFSSCLHGGERLANNC